MKQIYLAAFALVATSAMASQPLGMPRQLMTRDEGAQVSNEIIYDAPEGETKYYNDSYAGWVYWGPEMGLNYMAAAATNEMVWCDNGEVYIKNPVGNYSLGTYAKGTYADGKITVELPQCIGTYYDDNGEPQFMYLNKLVEEELDGVKYYMICDPDDDVLVYDVLENGDLVLNLGNDGEYDPYNGVNPPAIVGITYSNEPHALQVWSGYGDAFQTWTYLDLTPVCPPDGAEVQHWAFETGANKFIVDVVEDGNDVYLSGIASYVAGYWFKGTKDGDKIVFPSGQYMGMNEWGQLYYFVAAELFYVEEWDFFDYKGIDAMTMVWDADTQKYVAEEGQVMTVSSSPDPQTLAVFAAAENASMWQQTPEMLNANLLAPSVTSYVEFNAEMGSGSITWDIPNENVNGAILPGTDLYYNFYVDGDLFEFMPDEYPLFTEPTTDVPYNAGNYYDISSYGTSHTIAFKFSDAESFGLQSFYKAADGTIYSSELVTYDVVGTGVAEMGAKEVVATEYFDLAGVKVESPERGIFIKASVYADGSRKVQKVAIR